MCVTLLGEAGDLPLLKHRSDPHLSVYYRTRCWTYTVNSVGGESTTPVRMPIPLYTVHPVLVCDAYRFTYKQFSPEVPNPTTMIVRAAPDWVPQLVPINPLQPSPTRQLPKSWHMHSACVGARFTVHCTVQRKQSSNGNIQHKDFVNHRLHIQSAPHHTVFRALRES